MNKHSLIRTIYLYLFSLIGLVLIVTGSVGLVEMGLKAFVFKQADKEQSVLYREPTYLPFSPEKLKPVEGQTQVCLTEEEKASFASWERDYQNWKELREKVDPLSADRQRRAASNLSMILIGLPLYLFHWGLIRKELKNLPDIQS